jgi:hypothetical protein
VLLDLDQPELGIQKLWHGEGDWKAGATVADLGQFLLGSAAWHHALTVGGPEPLSPGGRSLAVFPAKSMGRAALRRVERGLRQCLNYFVKSSFILP